MDIYVMRDISEYVNVDTIYIMQRITRRFEDNVCAPLLNAIRNDISYPNPALLLELGLSRCSYKMIYYAIYKKYGRLEGWIA